MGANRDKKQRVQAPRANVSQLGRVVVFAALGVLTATAFAFDFGDDDDSADNVPQVVEDSQQSSGQPSTVNPNAGWLGFGRNSLKPGSFSGDTSSRSSASPLDHPGASSRLENSSGTTAFFNTAGFNDRGIYQIVPGWTFTPGFEARETFTDNVALRSRNGSLPSGLPTTDVNDVDFVTELNPSIKLFGDHRRYKFQLRYLAQSLIYANNTEFSDVRHRLFSAAQTELLPRLFFFEGSTSITQQNAFSTGRGITSNFGPGSYLGGVGDNINFVGDRSNVLTYTLSPYIRSRLRNIANIELRYTYSGFEPMDTAENGQTTFGSNLTRGYRALIESGSMFTRLKWRLGYNRRDAGFGSGGFGFGGLTGVTSNATQGGSSNRFEEYFTSFEYPLVPQFSALATVGYQDNSFGNGTTLFNSQKPRGIIWDIGGRWAPSIRTSLQATYGQRFFGDRYFVDLSHRASHSLFHVTYTEEATLGSLINQAIIEETAGGGVLGITTPTSNGASLATPISALDLPSNVVIRRNFTAAATYTGLRNDLTLQFFRDNRQYLNVTGGQDQELLSITGIWTHSLSPDSSMDAAVGWTDVGGNTNIQGANNQLVLNSPGNVWNYTLNFSHRVNRNLATLFGFRRIERTASTADQEYTENRVFGSIRFNY